MTGTRRNLRKLTVYTDASMQAGAEQALATLVANLDESIDVSVVGSDLRVIRAIADRRETAAAVLVPPLATKADLANSLTVRRTLADLGPSVIHLNKTEVPDLQYVECVAKTLRCRVVSVVHHVERPATRPSRLLTKALAWRAEATVAVSPSLARQLESLLGLPNGRVHSIQNALPRLPRSAPRTGARFTVGVLARFIPHKAVDDLIAAVASIDSVHLIIGGDGPERHRLERLAWRLGVSTRVEFLGWVDPSAVLDHCDVVASAARIEGHPMSLLDARRRGIPIIAADVGGVSEIVEHDVNGILVPPGHVMGLAKAIGRLRDDQPLLRSMATAAGTMANAADDPRAMAAAYERLYWPDPASAPHPSVDERRPTSGQGPSTRPADPPTIFKPPTTNRIGVAR